MSVEESKQTRLSKRTSSYMILVAAVTRQEWDIAMSNKLRLLTHSHFGKMSTAKPRANRVAVTLRGAAVVKTPRKQDGNISCSRRDIFSSKAHKIASNL